MSEEPIIKMVTKTDSQRRIQIPAQICEKVGIKPNQEIDIRLVFHGEYWVIVLAPLKHPSVYENNG